MTVNEGLLKEKWVYFLRTDEKLGNQASKAAESLKIGRRVKVGVGWKSQNVSSCNTTEEALDNSLALFIFILLRIVYNPPFIPLVSVFKHTKTHTENSRCTAGD